MCKIFTTRFFESSPPQCRRFLKKAAPTDAARESRDCLQALPNCEEEKTSKMA